MKAILRVVLNTEEKGGYPVVLEAERDVLLSGKDLMEIGFRAAPGGGSLPEAGFVSLKSLFPSVTYTLDEQTSTLFLTAEPRLLRKRTFDLGRRRGSEAVLLREITGFVNYSLGYGRGDAPDSVSFSVPWETGIHVGRYLGFSGFSYAKSETVDRNVRLSSGITRDDPEQIVRSVLGDYSAHTGALGGGGSFGGASISRNFSLTPYFVRTPGLELSGVLPTPSEVTVYVDGIPVRKEKLSPGEFTFSNLPVRSGPGTTSLAIRDAFGREESIVVPFYFSASLLKPGVHDFSYNLGFRREKFGEKSFDYGKPAFAAYHRIGLTGSFSGGMRAEAEPDLANIGATATFLAGRAGEAETALAISSTPGKFGIGAYGSYTYTGTVFNFRLGVKGVSRNYANLSLEPDADKAGFDGLAGVGIRLKSVGALSATYSCARKYIEGNSDRSTLIFSRNLSHSLSLTGSYSLSRGEETEHFLFAGLSIVMGNRFVGSATLSAQDDSRTTTLEAKKSVPRGPGFGYVLRGEKKESDGSEPEMNGGITIDYNAAWASCSAGYQRTADKNRYELRAAGALVYVDGSFHPTRPVNDGFALVKVGDIEGVRVYSNNQEEGRTDGKGEMILPHLISYLDNKVALEPLDVPVDHGITDFEKYILPPYRGGGTVTFDAPRIQGFMGRLFLSAKGKKTAAEYFGLDISLNGEKKEGIVGKEGEFYFENVPAGDFPARVFQKDKECRFTITIPKNDKPIVNLGEIVCEMD